MTMPLGMELEAARTRPTLTWLAAAFACAACALAAQIGADARWLAAIGAAIVRAGALPHAIPYASAPSAAWHDAPAFGQLVFHGAHSLLGDRGLVLAQAAAAGIALLVLALDLRGARARDGVGATVVLALLVAAPAAFLIVRAQLFSLALFPVVVLLLRSEARHPSWRIWLAVPLIALWANLHGGVLIGFAVLAAYLLLQRFRDAPALSMGVFAASAMALLATPMLLHSVDYYAGVLRGEAAAERFGLWAPLSLHDPLDLLFVAIALPLLAAALRNRPATWEIVVLLALAGLSVEARRNGLWLLLFAATPAARAFGRASARNALSRRIALACGCIPLLMLVLGLTRTPISSGAGDRLLQQAARAAGTTPILADPLDAEQLALRGTQIWIGNPLDAFTRAEQRVYLEWLQGLPAADSALAPIHVALVTRGSQAQLRLAHQPGFRELGRDSNAVLYGRRD
jgi:hypothetical protein